MKKKLFAILLCGVMALGLAGCSNPVSDSKKELEDAKKDLEETYKKYGWVEKETVNTILAKFNTEIMDGGLNTPASDDYMVVDNGKYWFALTDDVAFYLKPVESSGNKEKDISKVGLCTGAGFEFIDEAKANGCDCYITSDVKFHEAQKALNMDMCLIDATHYGTENIIVPVLRDYIQDEANKAGYEISVKASKVNGQVFDYIK